MLLQTCLSRRQRRQKRIEEEKALLTLQTDEVFRSVIIYTNKLPYYPEPLRAAAKVRNVPRFSKYHSFPPPYSPNSPPQYHINSHRF